MSTISVRVADGVAHLELNRPEVRNAINVEMVREITASLDQLSAREEVRALVLSGAGGKAFASGADISELRERTHREALLAINASIFQSPMNDHSGCRNVAGRFFSTKKCAAQANAYPGTSARGNSHHLPTAISAITLATAASVPRQCSKRVAGLLCSPR